MHPRLLIEMLRSASLSEMPLAEYPATPRFLNPRRFIKVFSQELIQWL